MYTGFINGFKTHLLLSFNNSKYIEEFIIINGYDNLHIAIISYFTGAVISAILNFFLLYKIIRHRVGGKYPIIKNKIISRITTLLGFVLVPNLHLAGSVILICIIFTIRSNIFQYIALYSIGLLIMLYSKYQKYILVYLMIKSIIV